MDGFVHALARASIIDFWLKRTSHYFGSMYCLMAYQIPCTRVVKLTVECTERFRTTAIDGRHVYVVLDFPSVACFLVYRISFFVFFRRFIIAIINNIFSCSYFYCDSGVDLTHPSWDTLIPSLLVSKRKCREGRKANDKHRKQIVLGAEILDSNITLTFFLFELQLDSIFYWRTEPEVRDMEGSY